MNGDFLDRIKIIIQKHLDDENFGVTKLASEIGISNSQLLRRIKSLTGKPVNILIRENRLDEALRLIKNHDYTASEIAYKVGFSSPSYFCKCFHDYFGYTPGECKTKNKASFVESKIDLKSVKLIRTKMQRNLLLSILTLAVVVISYLLLDKSNFKKQLNEFPSIAVLPFKNINNEKENQYFVDGVVEEVFSNLQQMPKIRVISRTSVEQYRNTTKPASKIGRELKVNYLLEGSVRKSEDQVMITVQLVNVRNNSHIWTNNFSSEYTIKGIFDIQREIAEKIVKALEIKISPEKLNEITEANTKNIHAYELYQKALSNYYQVNTANNELTILISRQSILIDSNYADAYGLLANAYTLKNINFDAPENWLDSALYYANKGLVLDNNCWWCYNALAKVQTSVGNNELFIEYNEKAIRINPNNSNAYFNLINKLYNLGKWTKSLQYLHDYLKLSPENHKIYHLSWLYYNAGALNKALLYAKKIKTLDQLYLLPPTFSSRLSNIFRRAHDSIGFNNSIKVMMDNNPRTFQVHYKNYVNYCFKNNNEKIIEHFENNEDSNYIYSCVPYSYWKLGLKDKAVTLSEKMLTDFGKDVLVNDYAYTKSLDFLYKDSISQSIVWLDTAIERGYLFDISKDHRLESLRGNKYFQELITKQENKREEVLALITVYNFPDPEDM